MTMALTREQAIALTYRDILHEDRCSKLVGPRGGVTVSRTQWRVSGQVKVWKRSGAFRVPIKFGLYVNAGLTGDNMEHFHLPAECPANQ